MDIFFSQANYVLKRQGLAIVGKYHLFGAQENEPLLYIEQKTKWLAGQQTIHAYADEKKTREILRLQTSASEDADMDIIEPESGLKIGSISATADNFAEVVKDAWEVTDISGNRIAKLFEKNTGQAVLREMLDETLPQRLDITVEDALVGELRQKVKILGYELGIDFSMDAAHLLDRRLGLATAIYAAYHQGSGMD